MPAPPEASLTVKVWDAPLRLFHWLLAALVTLSVSTGYLGGNAMRWHVWSGCAILGLLIFRLLWGFAGSTTARFAHFVRGPRAALGYARGLGRRAPSHSAGHNPLGGWMVLALLASAALQAGTGLFSNDDIATEGPLYHRVSKTTSDAISAVHQANAAALLTLIGLHVAAVLYYLWYKREDLLRPMLTGVKRMPAQPLPPLRFPGAPRALALAALAAAALAAILNC
ncbi:MAG TPA: cytochrome b/b6 domain-containing protein [Burkholderiales bacterium]|nr:cytochrome b/b6 domain-containing protein [Burkholderiales bacterium]